MTSTLRPLLVCLATLAALTVCRSPELSPQAPSPTHVALAATPLPPPPRPEWRVVAPGVEHTALRGGLALSPALLDAHAVRVDPTRTSIRVLDLREGHPRGLTAAQVVEQGQARLVINGGFFDEEWRPLGLLVTGGKVLIDVRPVDWGVFFARGGPWSIVHTRDLGSTEGITEALQVGPRLVVGGTALKLKPQISRRSAVGIQADGKVFFLATSTPVHASDLATLMVELGARDALNLDGGPSTQLCLRAGDTRVDVSGGYEVPTAIGVTWAADAP